MEKNNVIWSHKWRGCKDVAIPANEWLTEIVELPQRAIRIDRWLKLCSHWCANYSIFSCCILIEPWDQEIQSSSICAKCRLALFVGVTIPRSKFLGMFMRVWAGRFIVSQLHLEDTEVTLWSDSKCALYSIRDHSRLVLRFMQNRVEEMRFETFVSLHAEWINRIGFSLFESDSMDHGGQDQHD